MKKKLFMSILAFFASVGTMLAGQGSYDGIYYYLYGKYLGYHAKVIAPYNGTKYAGSVDIPSSFKYDELDGNDNGTYIVSEIDESAFSSCNDLTSVTIPNTVKEIGKSAFSGCTGVNSIVIPSSVSKIGNYAFGDVLNIVYNGTATGSPWGARSINGYVDELLVYSDASRTTLLACSVSATGEIYIPNSVTSIGERAFSGCAGLTSVIIPNSVTSIGERAFSGCAGLTSVIIPNSVTSIGEMAFFGCAGLTSIIVPNSVTSIGEGAFSRVLNIVYNGSAIGSPWGAKSVNGFVDGYLVYSDETKTNLLACSPAFVGELTIPNSVTSIGKSAFSGCSGLTSVTIPNSVTSIGADAFSGCSSLTGVYITDLLAWCNIKFLRDFLSNSSNPLSYAHNLYLNGNLVTNLSIPDGVTSIGEDAFYNCSSLTSVTIPDGVTSIGSDAFYYCTSLTSVTIGSSVTSIGSLAFDGCTSLTSVTIGNSVTSIGSGAFADCSSLTLVTIPNSVTSIGKDAFYNCSSLTGVYITDLVAWCNIKFDRGYYGSDNSNPLSYAHNLYLNGTLVTDLTIPDGVTSISDYAFYGCSSLTSVTIPNSVTSIGSSAFSGCSSLTGVYITDLTAWCNILFSYEANPLSYAHNLYLNGTLVTDLSIPDGVTSIGSGVFSGCSALTSVTIPNSVTSIGVSAFSGCSGLTSVTISNSVTSIGNSAFSGCSSLTSVTIPNSVTSIGDYAFYNCSSLKSVKIETTTPPGVYK
ncbi:MAG: leucine-rich repeat domain-containing protein, partial [Paludibacteraceae bacterium]|nr:leucine-rich repeat domain-containing protein [Paludibacteraceae bacterium]